MKRILLGGHFIYSPLILQIDLLTFYFSASSYPWMSIQPNTLVWQTMKPFISKPTLPLRERLKEVVAIMWREIYFKAWNTILEARWTLNSLLRIYRAPKERLEPSQNKIWPDSRQSVAKQFLLPAPNRRLVVSNCILARNSIAAETGSATSRSGHLKRGSSNVN